MCLEVNAITLCLHGRQQYWCCGCSSADTCAGESRSTGEVRLWRFVYNRTQYGICEIRASAIFVFTCDSVASAGECMIVCIVGVGVCVR